MLERLIRPFRALRRWVSALDRLQEVRGELRATLALLEAERAAVASLEAERVRMRRDMQRYHRFAGAIDEARTTLGLEGR